MLSKKTQQALKNTKEILETDISKIDRILANIQEQLDKENAEEKKQKILIRNKEKRELQVQSNLEYYREKKNIDAEIQQKKLEDSKKCIEPSDIIEEDFNMVMKPGLLDNIMLNDPVDIDIINKLLISDFLESTPIYEFINERVYLNAYRDTVINNTVPVNYIKTINNSISPINSMAMSLMRNKVINTIINGNMIGIFIQDSVLTVLNVLCNRERFKTDKIKMVLKNKHFIIDNIMNKYSIEHEHANNILSDVINIKNIDLYENILDIKINNNDNSDNLQSFLDELEDLTFNYFSKKYLTQYVNLNPNNYDSMDTTEKRNIISSFLINKIINEFEYQILNITYSFLIKKKIIDNNNAVLYKSGILVEKKNYTDMVLHELSKNVFELMGIDIQFILRQLTDKYDLSNIQYIKSDDRLYFEYKTDFEKNHFIVRKLVKYCRDDNGELSFFSLNELKNMLKDKYKNNFFTFFDKWVVDSEKRSFEKIVFEPNLLKHNSENYNLYKGFFYDRVVAEVSENIETSESAEAIESICDDMNNMNNMNNMDNIYFFQVLRNVFTDENEYSFFVNWIAHIIQFPYKKTKKCIVIYNNLSNSILQVLMNIILKLFDKYGFVINANEIGGIKHNTQLDNKFFTYGCDEIKNKKYILNKLDYKIITYQSKNDFLNFCISTNDLKIVSSILNDTNYYAMKYNENSNYNNSTILTEELNNDNTLCKIFSFFKYYNVNTHLFLNPEKTTFQKNYRFELVPIFKQMIYNNPDDFKSKSLSANEIYQQSLEYAKTINYNMEGIKYSEYICSVELPLYFREVIKIHRGHTYYDFYEHNCNNFNEYLKNKDTEYYNYVNKI